VYINFDVEISHVSCRHFDEVSACEIGRDFLNKPRDYKLSSIVFFSRHFGFVISVEYFTTRFSPVLSYLIITATLLQKSPLITLVFAPYESCSGT
jgi:hypothetical protein